MLLCVCDFLRVRCTDSQLYVRGFIADDTSLNLQNKVLNHCCFPPLSPVGLSQRGCHSRWWAWGMDMGVCVWVCVCVFMWACLREVIQGVVVIFPHPHMMDHQAWKTSSSTWKITDRPSVGIKSSCSCFFFFFWEINCLLFAAFHKTGN